MLGCFFFAKAAFALHFFVEPLYWQLTETDDWAYLNNNNAATQVITYKTISFPYRPGLRLGVGYEGLWDSNLSYTNYYTNAKDSATGNLVSSYLGATLAKPSGGYFYNAGQINFSIHYNLVNWDFGKRFQLREGLLLRPSVGLTGGCINQSLNSSFQGTVSTSEDIVNKFTGLGPQFGLEGQLTFLRHNHYEFSLLAIFTTSYLMGHWVIKDRVVTTNPTARIINVPSRNMGALAFQSKIGAQLTYQKFSMSLVYEMNDWINQLQIYDDNTGTHTNDLSLQGLSFKLAYHFS